MKVNRIDNGLINFMEETPEGYYKGDGYATRYGVFNYLDESGNIVKELRHPDDVLDIDSLASMQMIPVTNNHPPVLVDSQNSKQYSVGYTGQNIRPDGRHIVANLVITDEQTIRDIDNGKVELSLGYEVEVVEELGNYDGIEYTHRQKNIKYNHLAIVDSARAGKDAKLKFDNIQKIAVNQDKFDSDIKYKKKDTIKTKDNSMVKIKTDNGMSYDGAPEVQIYVDGLKSKNTELQEKCDSTKTELDKANARADAAEAKVKELEKVDHSDAIQKAAKELVEVMDTAKEVLSEDVINKYDSKTSLKQIKVDCLTEKFDKDFSEKSDAYIDASFDIMSSDIKKVNDNAQNTITKGNISKTNNDSDDLDNPEKVRADEIKKMLNNHLEGNVK